MNPLTRLANLVSRAVLRRVDDSKRMQLVQLTALEGETRADIERVQQYGFTSVPKEGAEAVAVFPGGDRSLGFVIATDDRRYRLTGLQAGEVALYTDQGDKVVLERGGTIRVTASTKVVIAAPLVELAGNTEAAVKGTTFRSADAAFDSSLASAATTLAAAAVTASSPLTPMLAPGYVGTLADIPVLAAALAATNAALTAYGTAESTAASTKEAGASTFLSTKVKLS